MKKSIRFIILILALALFTGFTVYAETGDTASEAEGPGVATGRQSLRSPRIPEKITETDVLSETVTDTQTTEAKAAEETGTDVPAEGAEAEVVALPGQPSFEERAAADLLLTEEERPKTGELYHSAHFYSSSATITVHNLGTDDTVIRFYSPEDELVFSIYVRAQEKLKVKIPGGNYRMNQAFGEKWYGKKDLFGNCGRYCTCSIGGNPLFTIKRSGKYVISTMGQGDAFSKVEVTKEDF